MSRDRSRALMEAPKNRYWRAEDAEVVLAMQHTKLVRSDQVRGRARSMSIRWISA